MSRKRRSISFAPELLDKIDKIVEEDSIFKDLSHFIKICVREYLKNYEDKT